MILEIEGCRFGYDEAGEGQSLLLLHGFPYQRRFWEFQMGKIPVRTVAVDLPGFGESSNLPGSTADMVGYVAALRLFCRGIGLDHPAVAGHSFGGYIALAWARLFPGELSGIALVASKAGADSRDVARSRLSMATRLRAGADPAPMVAEMPGKMLCRSCNTFEGQRDVRELMDPLRPDGIADAQHAMAGRSDNSGALASIDIPALVLAGEEDQLIPLEDSGILAAALPQGRLVVPPKTGHFVAREAPDAASKALSEWVARIEVID